MKHKVILVGTLLSTLAGLWRPAVALVAYDPVQATNRPAAGAAEQYYRQGLERLAQGDLDRAAQAFRRALDSSPQMVEAMLGLAEIAFKRDDLPAARTWIGNASRAEPDNPHVLYTQARLFYLDRNFEETERYLLKTLSIEPGFTQARISLGDLYMQAFGDPVRAAQAYRQVLQEQPDHAGAHYALGMALLREGKEQEAVRELQEAARLAPDNPLPLVALGRHFLDRQPAKAEGYLNQALAIDSNNVDFLMLRSRVFEKLGKGRLALGDLEKVVELKPTATGAWLRLGMLHQSLGENEKASEAYLRVLRQNSKAAVAYNNLAWMAAEEGRNLDQALKWARKAKRLSPDLHSVWDTLGWVYRARKEYPQAVASLKRAAQLAPRDAQVHYHLGVVYAESGMTGEARTSLEKAMSLSGDDSSTAKAAGELLRSL